MDITKADIEVLQKQHTNVLASWWSALNRYEWPNEIADPEVKEYVHNGRRGQLMHWIEERITRKECLRDWNADDKTNSEFEKWWT